MHHQSLSGRPPPRVPQRRPGDLGNASTQVLMNRCLFSGGVLGDGMSLGDGLHLEEDNKILASKRGRATVENTFAPSEKDAMHTHPSVWYYPHQTRKQAGRQK